MKEDSAFEDIPTVQILRAPPIAEAVQRHFLDRGWTPASQLPAAFQQPEEDCLLGRWFGSDGASAEWVSDGWIEWLEFRATGPEELAAAARALPHIQTDEVTEWLAGSDPDTLIRGLRAAGKLADPGLALALLPLQRHPNEAVRVEAARALAALAPVLAVHGAGLLRAAGRQQPGAHPAWNLLQPAWFRRQTLRWLLQDFPAPTAGVDAVLRAALADPDWEVRAGALIGAVRYRLRPLAAEIERCPLPKVSRNGPVADDRALLRALRQVGLALLAGRTPPPLAADASPKALALDRLARLLSVPETLPEDKLGCFVAALTKPVIPGGSPAALPPGVTESVDGYWLGDVALVWVPPLASFPGDTEPLRQVRGGGFFIAAEPLMDTSGYRALGLEETQAFEQNSGHSVWRLPTPWEWRSATSSDGRRFPWGNGFQDDGPLNPGPWGTFGHGSLPEWGLDPDGALCLLGPRCADCKPGDGPARLRPVLCPSPAREQYGG